ncbi:hypothetical protein [Roseibium sp. Sym1]|uniref:hypothetical protein n=1 Tax=Roseibium sp. Sym1 TaxID=3016006 RepID=UPI0022B355A5|nr:hypothetical protein [Roseibium sp. Sym1]
MMKPSGVLCAAAGPLLLSTGLAFAQEFDLPPVLEGDSVVAAPVIEDEGPAADVGVASPEPDDIPLPDIAVGEIPPIEDSVEAEVTEAETSPPVLASKTSSLELELRGFRNEDQQGDDIYAGRFSAHWFGRNSLSENTALLFNLRARAAKIEAEPFEVEDDTRLDVQELGFAWDTGKNLSLEAGRINIRNGVALGFNPTDWFKANSLVTIDSQDPGDRREERLGTVVVNGATSIGNTLVQAGYRPEISAAQDTVITNADIVGLNLNRTNPSYAAYAKVSPGFGGNISFTGNVIVEDDRWGGGAEVSGALGNNLVLYGETFIQDRMNLSAEALEDGSGSAAFRRGIGADQGFFVAAQLAVGATWSFPEVLAKSEDISLSLEYHYNGAGLNNRELDALADASGSDLAAAGAVHSFASREQEPLAQHQLFARFAWNDFWNDADFTAIGYYVPHDHSGLAQIAASYPFNDNLELSMRAFSVFGSDTSVYGSNPLQNSIQLAVKYTF